MGVIGSIVLIGGIAAVITCLVLFAPYVGTVMGITLASLVALAMVIGACFAIYNRYSQPGVSIFGDIQTLLFGIEWFLFVVVASVVLAAASSVKFSVWFVICIPAVILSLMIGSYLQNALKNARHNNYAKDMTHTAKVAANQNKDATMKLYRAMKQNITAEELEKDLDATATVSIVFKLLLYNIIGKFCIYPIISLNISNRCKASCSIYNSSASCNVPKKNSIFFVSLSFS